MLLHLDFGSEIPIYQQIRDQIVVGIADGRLPPGEKLPTVRALAEESGVNMMTVSKAYQLLKQEGYLQTGRRSGTVVCPRGDRREPEGATLRALRVSLSELRLAGLDREAALALCARLYDEGGSV